MKTTLTLKKRTCLCFSFFLLVGLAIQLGAAIAAEMPMYDRLTPLTNNIDAPADVTVDKMGRVYVAETGKNRVTVLSQSGKTIKVLRNVIQPISVAVDSQYNIYVGSATMKKVLVYNSALQFQYDLGKGSGGNFLTPIDISIDSNDTIYVVDMFANLIKVFNANGTPKNSFGTPGNLDGQLWHPKSLAVDENTNELVVLDLQQIYDERTRKSIDGARVQYFDRTTYAHKRGFSKFGYNYSKTIADPNNPPYYIRTIYDYSKGEVTRPNQLTVDSQSRVYLTDAVLGGQGKVLVYDGADITGFQCLGTIDSDKTPLHIPNGIAIGDSNRMYVASVKKGHVEVFGLENFTAMLTTPAELAFSVIEKGKAAAAQNVTVNNSGKAAMNWGATSPETWISTTNANGTLTSGNTANFAVSVNHDGFGVGEHTGSVVVDTGAGAAEEIKIVLKVEPNPLKVSPGALNFATTVGTTAEGQELTITNANGSSLLFDVSANETWITLNKTNGMTADTVRVYVDTTALDPGAYSGIITVVPQNDDPVPVEIAVTLTLIESTTPPETPPVMDGGGKPKWNKKWTVSQVLPGTNLNGVAGSSGNDVIAVGDSGTILQFDGKGWTQASSGTVSNLNSAWSISDTNAFAVGAEGTVLNFNGTDWAAAASTGSNDLLDIWGNADTNMFTVDEFGAIIDSTFASSVQPGNVMRSVFGVETGEVFATGEAGEIFQYSGISWDLMTSNTSEWLNAVWANSTSDVYAVGENGTIMHYDGVNWTPMTSGTAYNLNGVCALGADEVFAVGANSVILYYDGKEWSAMDAGAGVDLNDVWCTGKDVFAVGDDGTIIHGKGKGFNWVPFIQLIAENASRTSADDNTAGEDDQGEDENTNNPPPKNKPQPKPTVDENWWQ